MADKYISLDGADGAMKEREATVDSTGVAEAGDVVALDGAGKISLSLMPSGVAPDVKVLPASEALSAGNWVNIWSDAGTMKVRKADASTAGKEAHGFVLEAVVLSGNAEIFFDGVNSAVAGLTGGLAYFLSATVAGASITTPPSGTGQIVQKVGVALSPTEVAYERNQSVERA